MKHYDGSELLWSIEDVQAQADNLDIELNVEESENILTSTFKDNEYLMQLINEMITDSILTFDELRNNEHNKYICGSCGEGCIEYTYSEDRDIDECNNCKASNNGR